MIKKILFIMIALLTINVSTAYAYAYEQEKIKVIKILRLPEDSILNNSLGRFKLPVVCIDGLSYFMYMREYGNDFQFKYNKNGEVEQCDMEKN